jgi:hypothetical protein
MNQGDAMGRASGRALLLCHPNDAKFFAENERKWRKREKLSLVGGNHALAHCESMTDVGYEGAVV